MDFIAVKMSRMRSLRPSGDAASAAGDAFAGEESWAGITKGVTRIKNARVIGLRNGDKVTGTPVGWFEDKVKLAWITRGWSAVENRGQERVKKCRFAISAESALKNFSFRGPMNDVCHARIDFGSPRKSRESIFSHVPVPGFPTLRFSDESFQDRKDKLLHFHEKVSGFHQWG